MASARERMTAPAAPLGLTTSAAPFIEQARASGNLFITQPYAMYSEDNHDTWRRLYARMQEPWARFANQRFLEGLATLRFDLDRVPRLEDVNAFMAPLTGFRAKAVAGYVPAYQFFECLRKREFPTTITIRDGARLDYLPEPDIFHDIAGHVPMHTDAAFANALVRFGEVARAAAERLADGAHGEIDADRLARLGSVQRALARFFWFTVEFGLMRDPTGGSPNGVRAYGSGLLSSLGELGPACLSPTVQRVPFQIEWVVNQGFDFHSMQPLLFVIDSFEQLFDEVGRLEQWVRDGRLDHVAGGEPAVSQEDLESFVAAVTTAP